MRCVLCDDDPIHNTSLSNMLGQIIHTHQIGASIVLSTTAPEEVLQYAETNRGRTIYFLDLELGVAGNNGLDIARSIREKDPLSYIVYISAHLEYAMECLRTKASDFLIKPFLFEQLEQCVLGIMRDQSLVSGDVSFQINVGSITYNVSLLDILYFEKQREYLCAYTQYNKYRWRESYASIFARLDGSLFQQIHKGYVVNIHHVLQYDRQKRLVTVTNGHMLPVSRGYKKSIENAIDKRRDLSVQ